MSLLGGTELQHEAPRAAHSPLHVIIYSSGLVPKEALRALSAGKPRAAALLLRQEDP